MRDDITDKDGETIPGQPDKRLFVVEAEFASIMAQCRREGNTLSTTIRNLWDGGTLSPLTKTDRTVATDPHVCINGHITIHELVEKATGNDMANGFLNRFVVLYSKCLQFNAFPERTPQGVIYKLAERIANAVDFGQKCGELSLSQQAKQEWGRIYPCLATIDMGGILNSMFVRSRPYVLMLAAIFAVLDCRRVIYPKDLHVGISWIEYWRQSLVYIFDGERKKVEADKDKEFAERVYEAICQINDGKGCTKTEINRFFCSHKSSSELSKAIELLLVEIPTRLKIEVKKGKGRPTKIYKPA